MVLGGRGEIHTFTVYTMDNVENRTQDEGWGWGLVRVSVVPDNFQFFYLIFFFSFKLI